MPQAAPGTEKLDEHLLEVVRAPARRRETGSLPCE